MKKLLSMSLVMLAAFAIAFSANFTYKPQTQYYGVSLVAEAEAKFRGGGGFRSFRRSGSKTSKSLWNRSSKSKSSKSYKPAPSKKKVVPPSKKSGGYGKTTKKSGGTKSVGKKSSTSSALQRRASTKSMATHRKETSKFKKPVTRPNASTMRNYRNTGIAKSTPRMTRDRYYSNRSAYYGRTGWSQPVYVHNSYSSFGMWDAVFMWSMLDLHRSMYYHHRTDPGFVQWRREADRLARDNAELRAKLNKLDAEMTTMQTQGVAVNANYQPNGVPSNVMLSADVVASQQGQLVMGTGGPTGNYYAFCKEIQKNVTDGMNVDCKNTTGSVANMDGMLAGKYGAIMVQSDVYNEWLRKNPGERIDGLQASVYPEVVFLIAHKDAGIDDISDIDVNKHRLYVTGGGAKKTLVGFARQDEKYANLLRIGVQTAPTTETLKMVANNPNGVMMYVCGLKCGLVQQANDMFGDKLRMAAVNDWDFNDAKDQFGKTIYRFVEIPTTYKNLQQGGWFGKGKDVESLAVEAVLIVSKDWVEQQGADGMAKLEAAIWPAMSVIQDRVGVPTE